MRCSRTRKCGQRFTLKKHPDLYVKNKYVCPVCGGYAYSDEQNRRNEMAKRENCECPMYPFKHAKGSLRACIYHPKEIAGVEWTEEEIRDYEACMRTRRSG